MTNKEAIVLMHVIRTGYICDPHECGAENARELCDLFKRDDFHEACVMAIEALEKMDNYNKMAKHLAELGFICEHMPLDNPWCEKHCDAKEKPDMECVEQWLKWSD